MDALTAEVQDEAPWCMLFADDIVLVDEDGVALQNKLNRWRQALEGVGLKISRTKTEYLFCDFGGTSSAVPLKLQSVTLPCNPEFKYLGSLLQNNCDIERDVRRRINVAWLKWRQVTGVTCDKLMPLKLKGQIYKSIIRPVM
ncbi:hypothetical protein K1T71_013669 [Dendrolimus kikuchii]|uniref:Uncharacterized protein n=1 Tax=Dendrolimus kikuchii TaxID=765133 RepID=A0ACC1CH52_9NEOP|nr:hypothetical protein K1T71_013669 [Dendrolimus kikuchii]